MEKQETRDELIIGRNPVMEALKTGRSIDALFVSKGEKQGSIGKILAMARSSGIPVKEVDGKKLDYMCGNAHHQGDVRERPSPGCHCPGGSAQLRQRPGHF